MQFDCLQLRNNQEDSLANLKSYLQSFDLQEEFPLECLSVAVKANNFEAVNLMMDNFYLKSTPQQVSIAEQTLRNLIRQIRNEQDFVLGKFEEITRDVPVISPAFRWAQSLNEVFIEIKWATRFDSPACLDTFDHEYKIVDVSPKVIESDTDGVVSTNATIRQQLYVSAMCRNDKTLL